MNFNWRLLTFSELMIMVFVIMELVVVVVALIAMSWVRSTSMRRQATYNAVRTRLIETISQIGPEGDARLQQQCLAALATLNRDQQRRLLTEMAEYAGSGGTTTDPIFAQLFGAAGLMTDARNNASARPWERLRAIREARAMADPAHLLAKLVRDELPDVRLGAFEALCSLGRADEALVALTAISNDGRLNRMRVTDSLAAARPFPTEQLIELAGHEKAEVRQVCIAALGQARQRAALEAILTAATDADTEVRINALRGLAELRDASALPVCLHALADPRWEVRSEGAKTCGVLAMPASAEPLGALLADDAEWVRHNAALSLVKCGPTGIAVLRQAAAEGNSAAQSALAEARLAPPEVLPSGGGANAAIA